MQYVVTDVELTEKVTALRNLCIGTIEWIQISRVAHLESTDEMDASDPLRLLLWGASWLLLLGLFLIVELSPHIVSITLYRREMALNLANVVIVWSDLLLKRRSLRQSLKLTTTDRQSSPMQSR